MSYAPIGAATLYVYSMLYEEEKESVYYVIGGPYVSDQAGLNRGPLILIVFHCYFVSTFCEDRINTFLILMMMMIRFARAEPADCPVHGSIVMCSMSPECSGPMKIGLKGIRPRSIIKPILSHLLCDNPIRAQ